MIFIAFALGFIGYLPLGNINLSVVQLSVNGSRRGWQRFILFAAIMEFIYCFGCLYGLELLLQQPQLVLFLNWSAVVIFLLLGIFTLLHKSESAITSSSVKRGTIAAVFNPLQIPFWLIWGVYVFENNLLKRETIYIALFSFICALGTVAVLWLYATAGKKIVEKLNVTRNILNRIIGSLLILLAVLQTVKLFE